MKWRTLHKWRMAPVPSGSSQQYVRAQLPQKGLIRADISVRGVYESQVEASLDIRVTETDAEFFKLKSVLQVLKTHETEKKRKYKKACEERRWHLTPFVCSVDGTLGKEAVGFLKRLAHKLAIKSHSSYRVVMGFVRAQL